MGQYSREQTGHLEAVRRILDVTAVAALFAPVLELDDAAAFELIALVRARNERPPDRMTHTRIKTQHTGAAESIDEDVRQRQAAQLAEMAEGDVIKAARAYAQAGDVKEAADVLTDLGTALPGLGKATEAAAVVDEILARIDVLPRGQAARIDLVCRLLTTRGDALLSTVRADEAEHDYRASLVYWLSGCWAPRILCV